MDTKALAEKIKPAVRGQSDKYSWRLHQHVKAARGQDLRVFVSAWSSWDGYNLSMIEEFKRNKKLPGTRQIWVGRRDEDGTWLHGRSLAQVCTPGESKMGWALSPTHHVSEFLDITDWFWRAYVDRGRCMFYPSEHKWLAVNSHSRKCAYCGEVQFREVKTVRKTHRKEFWTAQGAA